VTAAGGLSAHGAVTFSNISPWRRATFDNFAGALIPGSPQPAPTSGAYENAITNVSSYASTQTAASTQPLPALPGENQSPPSQVS